MNTVSVKKLGHDSIIPTKAHDDDAGWDLYSNVNAVLYPGDRMVVKTGIALGIPYGYYGRIAPRSGLAVKRGIDVLAGVVDAGYRNEIGVVLINHHLDHQFPITKGDRIAQIIFERVDDFRLYEVTELNPGERGMGGFGSSGT
jgi:dUTP pyrophosphatase|tara:strand:+ start:3888 stop:4316 length:429 start_codon:yes stop_codon:yes gene_type:complete